MKSIWKVMLAVCCLGMTIGCGTNPSKNENVKETLLALVVNGTQLMNTEGDTVVLHGVSYGWHQFWPRFYNASSVAYLVNDWGAQVLRASMGVDLDSACYVNKPEFGIECVTKVVDAAIENGVYVIIDWHSHNLRQEEAKEFFTQMATRYKGVPNVIYEVFNEPVEDSWEQVKSYSVEVIKTIRAIEPDAVILVGCPHWDQDIDIVAKSPIDGVENVMYTLHFYAATHKDYLRDKLEAAVKSGLPVFVSECVGMEASGNGPLAPDEYQKWLDVMEKNKVSWVNWSVSDKDETCSMLLPRANATGTWTDDLIKSWGKMVKQALKKYNR